MPVLYLIASGAPPAAELPGAVKTLRDDGWSVCAAVTPMALRFVDRDRLEEATGRPLRVEHRRPGDPPVFPPADAVAVAPASFNTVNKWALGVSDSLALGMLHELLGADLPIVAGVWAKDALRRHPAFAAHLDVLRGAGVRFVERAEQPAESGTTAGFPWEALRGALREVQP
jgi:phosphopantothenoylcysteine synthetase/decarboxylase